MKKVTVSREIAEALDKLDKDEWSKQFQLISHCKGFHTNGELTKKIYIDEYKVLETLKPLDFATCLLAGYTVLESEQSVRVEKLKVSRELAKALDRLDWSKQYKLIHHCQNYSGNGILCGTIYKDEFKVLEKIKPLEFATCLLVGYVVEESK